jgi:nicotinamide-nucleotide amidase
MNKKTEIISIGNEILSGLTVNTNASWIAQQLHQIGLDTGWITAVSDEHQEIRAALATALRRAGVVICTGGLGPTPDDITKKTICRFFKSRLVLHDETLEHIRKLFEGRNLAMPATNRQQAMVPDNGRVISNPYGTAPGLYLEKNGTPFYFLPGVPFEMKHLIDTRILSELQSRFNPRPVPSLLFRTTGMAESRLNELVKPVLKEFREITTAFLPRSAGVDLRISFPSPDAPRMRRLTERIRGVLGIHIFTESEKTLEVIASELLLVQGRKLGLAESFTGGLIGDLFTDIPGSSAYLQGSAVTYSNESKSRLLGVKPETIRDHGAVSEATVREMAAGAQILFDADCAVATTGIAGPTGATPDKPIGLCYLAAAAGSRLEVRKFIFGKDRRINKERGAFAAIELLRRLLIEQ